MNKSKKLAIIFKCAGLFFLLLAVVFFFLSFNVRRDIQEVFGFSSIAFIPIGVFCLFLGQIFQKYRSKRGVLGMMFLATGVTLILLGMVLAFGILITIFGFGVNPIRIYIDCALLFFGVAFIAAGRILIRNAK